MASCATPHRNRPGDRAHFNWGLFAKFERLLKCGAVSGKLPRAESSSRRTKARVSTGHLVQGAPILAPRPIPMPRAILRLVASAKSQCTPCAFAASTVRVTPSDRLQDRSPHHQNAAPDPGCALLHTRAGQLREQRANSRLSSGASVAEKRNRVLYGPAGTAKTQLASALGVLACQMWPPAVGSQALSPPFFPGPPVI